jgi:CBS domain-containing protein
MLTVRDLMRAGPLTLEPDDSLRMAVDVLVESGSGGAPVVSGGELVGVVSLTDVLAFEAESPIPAGRGAGPLYSLDGRASARAREAPAPGRWFTESWDGAGSDRSAHLALLEPSDWDALDEHAVREVMTRSVVSVGPDVSIREAARLMDRSGVHRLVVTEHGELVGVLGARDIVRAVASGDLVEAPAFGLDDRPTPAGPLIG